MTLGESLQSGVFARRFGNIAPPTPERRAELEREREEQERLRLLEHDRNRAIDSWKSTAERIGVRYKSSTLASFATPTAEHIRVLDAAEKFRVNLAEELKLGRGLILSGPRGTGKDHLAVALLRCAASEHNATTGWFDGQCLLADTRDLIGTDRSENNFVRDIAYPRVLLISDPIPPAGNLTDFQLSMLWRIIDRRYRDQKSTWFTMNTNGESEASQKLGGQLVDRMNHNATIIRMAGLQSFRRPQSII